MDAAIVTRSLTRRFRRGRKPWRRERITAVQDVSLEVPAGSIFGLVGPNGAGKTTLMRLVLGLLQPTEGTVELLGEQHGQFGSPALRRVGALIEEPRFLPFMTGRANLEQVALLLGGNAPDTVSRALADVGLADRADDRVKTYSLGMRQRLGLARCLLGHPTLLVLDEPTNGMDPQGIVDTRNLLQRYTREHGATVLLSSHQLHAIEQLCDRVAFMDDGRIVRAGELGQLAPSHRTYRIRVSQADEAASFLAALATRSAWTLESCEVDGDVVVACIDGEHDSAEVNRQLVVEGGFAVAELVQLGHSLEAIYRETLGSGHAVRWTE